MKFSIVIPTCNRWPLLQRCIDSVISNTADLSSVEIIVVSNGCTDGTPELVTSTYKNYPVKVIHWPERLGYSGAGNVGFNVAKGDYIVRLDSDVVVLGPTWLNNLVEPFLKYPTAGISGPSMVPVGDQSVYAADCIVFFCAMIKREVFNRIGFLDPVFNNGGGEDTDFSIRAIKAGYTVHRAVMVGPNMEESFPLFHEPEMHRGGESYEKVKHKEVCAKILENRYGRVRIL